MITVKELSERLRVSLSKAYSLVETRKIAHFRIDGCIRIAEEHVAEYLDGCRKGRGPDDYPTKADPRPRLRHLKL